MNHLLFDKTITCAQTAALAQDKPNFVVAVRVAQSAVPDKPHLLRLLDTALDEFPSPIAQRIIEIVARARLR